MGISFFYNNKKLETILDITYAFIEYFKSVDIPSNSSTTEDISNWSKYNSEYNLDVLTINTFWKHTF